MNFQSLLQLEPWEWPPTAAATLKAVIQDRSRPTPERIQALLCLGEGGLVDDHVAQMLLTLLSAADEPEEIRAAAAIPFGPALEEADEDLDFIEDKFSQATLQEIQKRLRQLFDDPSLPVLLRRRILEAAVRAPQSWQRTAVIEAFASDIRDWRLTAVFCMRYLGGFKKQVLQALHDGDAEIRCEAILAAGAFEIKEAWAIVAPLATAKDTDKDLRLAAIEAIATIRPKKARPILLDLVDDQDEDIASVAEEALAMAGGADNPFFDD